jgi:signal transduction histidine kinase/CheY-like chemotaxis protein/HPt (histidine-containing phosphotransfer) domain-containing protein
MSLASSSPFAFPQSGAGRLTWLYIAALSSVALLSLAGQAIVQFYFDRQMSDSNVINIAGRQRMLSQRIAKAALALRDAANPSQQAERDRELRETLALWQRCHRGLQRGDAELGLPGANSPEVQRMFAELEPSFAGVLSPAQRLSSKNPGGAGDPSSLAAGVGEILRHESAFLRGMDAIVSAYASEASQRVARVKRIEQTLLAITLAVLLLEGLFVFRPAVRRIRMMLAAIGEAGAKLATAKEAAEEANRAKTRFLAVTSHELRTPLHAVLGIAEQLQKTPLDASQQEGLAVLRDAAATLLTLVDDLLDLARIESGKLELRMEPVPLGPLVDRTLSLVRPAAEGKGLCLSLAREAGLPAAIVTDRLRLSQVLLNLLGNAVKFTDRGSVTLSLDRLPDENGRTRLRFKVADTGIGIPPDEQRRIFESFAQVDASLSRARGGVGLGLAIARRLAELLGGTLELTSQVGSGSQFAFAMTCDVAEGPDDVNHSASRNETRAPPLASRRIGFQPVILGSRSILVIDDAPANRYLAAALLRKAGYRVEAAASGREALRMIGLKGFDAALLDVHMPGMDGLELAEAMRKFQAEHARPRMPIIALTADVLPETATRLLQHSIDAVLHKPASEASILAALAAALETPSQEPGAGSGEQGAGSKEQRAKSKEITPRSPLPAPIQTRRSRSLARLGGNEALLVDLTAIFRRDALVQQSVVEEALERGDCQAVRRAVHRLRGQAMTLDAVELCGLLAKIEEHALAADLPPCAAYWREAVRELDLLVQTGEACDR